MSNIKAINNSSNNNLYKLQDNSTGFLSNAFPIRRFVKSSFDHEQAWIAAYKAETKKYFEAVLTNQKLDEIEKAERDQKIVPKRRILKQNNFTEYSKETFNPNLLDGFYLMQLCCVEDPLDLCSIDISDKNLKNIKEDDMNLFENIDEINANENNLNFESFKSFSNLTKLMLACNNIKTIRLKHEEFSKLETLDLSFNSLSPNDVAHLGILKNLKVLKLTGNNLTHLPDTFSKLYVFSKDNKKIVSEKFSNLEELYLDHNKLREEDSFDVIAVLKKLKRLYLNSNCITSIPNLKLFRNNHVVQEFNKSYYKRKNNRNHSARSYRRTSSDALKINETIVKDLDRPNSEINIHSSNLLRNSFILEEENEEDLELNNNNNINNNNNTDDLNKKTTNSSTDMTEKNFDLPFAELVFINLADNQIAEEDDLIPLVSWPMLNEVIIYGNPIVYNNVGYPPLLKQYLIDRLGVNIHRIRPIKPLKTPILLPQREHRIVDNVVPKIPKMPVEMRMLTYYNQDSNEKLTNFSSRDLNNNENLFLKRKTSVDSSFDSTSHNQTLKTDNVYKPFKQEKHKQKFSGNKNDSTNDNNDSNNENVDNEEECEYQEVPNDNNEESNDSIQDKSNKSYNSFFMTQVDQEETIPKTQSRLTNQHKPIISPRIRSADPSKNSRSLAFLNKFDKDYEILFKIENENQIKVPKDISSSVRALKQMLDHPLIFRDSIKELDKPQNMYKTTIKEPIKQNRPKVQPKLTQVNEILDTLRDRKTVKETSLNEALNKPEEADKSKRLLEKTQKRYEEIKRESLKCVNAPKKSRDKIRNDLEKILNEKRQTD